MVKVAKEDIIQNFFTDLVSLNEYQWFPSSVGATRKGEWERISEIFTKNGKILPSVVPNECSLYVCWLDDPEKDSGFLSLVFSYPDLGINLFCTYNRKFL